MRQWLQRAAADQTRYRAWHCRDVSKRSPEAPEIPAVAETIAGFEAVTWHGWVGPASLPEPIAQRLIGELTAIIKEPEVQKRLSDLTTAGSGLSGDAFGRFILAEIAKWRPIVDKAGIKMP